MARTPPPGIELAYENAAAKLRDQLARIDGVNARAGAVVVAGIALSGFLLSSIPHNPVVTWGVIALLLAAVAVVGVANWPIKWKDAPDPRVFASLANRSPGEMRRAALATLLAAYEHNARPLLRKGRWVNIAAAVELVALGLLVVGRAVWG
jgi:hypothetical protein